MYLLLGTSFWPMQPSIEASSIVLYTLTWNQVCSNDARWMTITPIEQVIAEGGFTDTVRL